MIKNFALAFSLLLLTTQAHAAIEKSASCSQVCGDLRSTVKANAKAIEEDYQNWQKRLAVKGDLVRYSGSTSAAEGLLDYMASFDNGAIREKSYPALLTFVMAKCFPESYVGNENAKLSGLVDTLWSTQHTSIEKRIFSCQ